MVECLLPSLGGGGGGTRPKISIHTFERPARFDRSVNRPDIFQEEARESRNRGHTIALPAERERLPPLASAQD